MNKQYGYLFYALLVFTASTSTFSSPADQKLKAKNATVACGGNYFIRLGGTEFHDTQYILRNYGKIPIRIRSFKIYGANGTLLQSYNGVTLPLAGNGVMGGGDDTLDPNQTARFSASTLLTNPLLNNVRPIQVRIKWTANKKVLVPEIVWVRTSRRRNSLGQNKEERARHLNNCRIIKFKD